MKFTGVNDKEFKALIEDVHAKALPKILAINCSFVMNGKIHHALSDLVIILSNSMRTTGGTAKTLMQDGTGEIRLNYRLLSKNPNEIEDVYLHELAHILANLMYQRCVGHTNRWKRVASAIGAKPERCHQMDVSEFKRTRAKQPRYRFTCVCREWYLTKNRLNKYLEYKAKYSKSLYSCPDCRKGLQVPAETLIAALEG